MASAAKKSNSVSDFNSMFYKLLQICDNMKNNNRKILA